MFRRLTFPTIMLISLALIFGAVPYAAAAAPEPLRVLAVHPAGPVPLVKQITVTFSEPMVPLGEMSRPPEQVPVVFEPEIKGRYRWLNVYTLVFEPDSPLEGSQKGTITVKKNTKALSGARLRNDEKTEFALPDIQVLGSYPEAGSQGLPLRPEFHVRFNQPLLLPQLQNQVFFQTGSGGRVAAVVKNDEEANRDRLPGGDWSAIIVPAADLPPNSACQLALTAGLASASGPLPSTREMRILFSTYGPFQIKEVAGYRLEKEGPYDPESGLWLKFTNQINPKDLSGRLKISPDYDLARIPEVTDEESEPVSAIWIPGPFEAATLYTLNLDPSLQDQFGQPLTGQNNFRVAFGPSRPVLELPGRQGVLETDSNPSYPFRARNLASVTARAYFLTPETVIPFIMKHELYDYLSSSSDDLLADIPPHEIKTAVLPIDTPPNTLTYQPVRLKQLLGKEAEGGVIYFDLNAPETNDAKTGKPVYERALVQVTDVGLSVKFGQSNTLIWATELATGKPLPKADLEIRNTSNHVLWRGQSDEQGLAMAPGATQLKIQRQEDRYGQPSMFVMANYKDSFSVVSTTWNEGIAPWNFGLPSRELESEEETMTWVMTSLPLYKPGDEVRFKVIQRSSNPEELRPPQKNNLLIQVQDSRGQAIEAMKVQLNRFGTASGLLTLPRNAPLGSYAIRVGVNEEQLQYAGDFQVEEYRKPTFAVEIKPSAPEVLAGEKLTAAVQADYHFGSPVSRQPVDYVVTAEPTGFTLPRFEDYAVIDWYSQPEEEAEPVPTVASGRGQLDARGAFSIAFTAEQARRPQPRSFQIEATVTDVDQRTVSRRGSVLVHPASFYLGLKTDRYVVGPGEKMTVSLIAASPDGNLMPGVTTDMALFRRTWQTVRIKGVGGYYHYVSKATDTLIQRIRTRTLEQPTGLDFTLEQGGFYYLTAEAKDQAGRTAASSTGFYAYGEGPAGWEHYDHDRIDLVPDKDQYAPGDTATILIKSPFTQAAGLLTVERNGVRRYETFNLDAPSAAVKVKLEEGDGPNVFISVLLVRGRISDALDKQGRDPGKPAFKAGYAQVKVVDVKSHLKVEVKPDRPQARPGEEVELTVQVTDGTGMKQQTEVALIVADASLLQLASEDVYYPERLFFAPRSLSVWTTDSRLNLIGRRHYGLKGANTGGGGMGAAAERYRRRFVSLALFEPHVVTDGSGLAKLRFTLPDNLTTFKIFAVANTDGGKFGTGTASLRVTKPLVIQSALPNFAGVGDEFTANVVVHNRSDRTDLATVTLSGENLTLLNPEALTAELAPGASHEFGFPVRVLPGSQAVFLVDAALGGEHDAAEFRVPLRFPNRLETSATVGRLTQAFKETVLVPKGTDPDRGGLTLTVSTSIVGTMSAAFDYLKAYPYECLEQKTSRALGDLYFLSWKNRLETPAQADPNRETRLKTYLEGLEAFQSFDGGFSFWPETNAADPYLTAYVLQAMNIMLNSGQPVDRRIMTKAQAYLTTLVNTEKWPVWFGEREKSDTRAYIALVLTETGQAVLPLVENIYNQRDSLSPFALACLMDALSCTGEGDLTDQQIKDLRDRLFGRAVITSREVHFEEKGGPRGLMASTIRTNAFALKALLHAVPDDPHVTALAGWLVQSRTDGHWGSTQNNASALMALTEYIRVMEEQPPQFSLLAVVDYEPLAEADFRSFETPPLERTVPMPNLAMGRKIPVELKLDGTGAAYYTLKLDHAPMDLDISQELAGFAVTRTYTRVDGSDQPITDGARLRRGDIIRVDVTLLVPAQRHWVVLEDCLPAGLEPINFNLATAPEHLQELLNKGYKPEEYFRRYWYEHREIRSDRVAVFARVLTEGAYTLSYLARVVTPGSFAAPGPRAEEMYAPEVFGRGAGMRLEVENN